MHIYKVCLGGEGMFRIGEFAKLSGLSIDTLYHYEKMGILIPKSVDGFTGYRGYDASQLMTVNKLLALKDAGFSLMEIAEVIKGNPSNAHLLSMLEEKASSLEDRLNQETNRLERLQTNIFLIKNGGMPVMNEIAIKRVEPILVASIRKTFGKEKFDEELGAMWAGVNKYIDAKGGKRTVPCLMLYHKGWVDLQTWEDTGAAPLDVEVAEPLTKPLEGDETVCVHPLPAVEKMACIIHKGAFSTIAKTNEALFDWIKQNGYSVNGALREIYHKGDWATDDEEEYVTELQVPLAP